MSDSRAKQLPTGEAPEAALDRSTAPPPFKMEEFARESDSLIRIEAAPVSNLPTAPPPPGVPEYAPGLTSGVIQSLGSASADAVPVLSVTHEDLEWFDLAPYARALLRYVNGRESIAMICERARLKVDEAIAAFHDLARDGLVTLQR